jgi:SAM-dependent methyltransferase
VSGPAPRYLFSVTVLIHVPCRLCGADDAVELYARQQEAGPPLGRLATALKQCRSCGFLYADPRPDPEALAAHYREAESASGAVWRETGPGSRHAGLAEARGRFLLAALAGRPPGRLLEVGCGRGELLDRVSLPGWRLAGLEPSPAAAAEARANGLLVREEPLERNGLPAGAFDAVLAVSVLEHLDDPGAGVDALARLSAPDGVLVLEVPDSARPLAQLGEFYSFEHLSHFTPATLARLLGQRGFALVALERDAAQGGFRAAFRRGGQALVLPDDRAELRAAVGAYAERRAALEQDVCASLLPRLARWRAAGTRVGVYGAGVHTRFVADLAPLLDCAVCVLDGDPLKQGGRFLGLPVHAPEEAHALELGAVVLSSRAFQDEMARRLEPFAAAGGEVVRLYP